MGMKIYKLFRYYYFRLYRWNLKAFGADELPVLNALLILSFFSYVHFLILILALQKFVKIPVFGFFETGKPFLILTLFIILGINYFLFVFQDKTKKVMVEFV
jgi:hypothetical protein